ncbi:MAG: sulfite exporter TauE/SafE family protein [Candidatus Zeuxoniibacter abyssi]|nr:MAG: sulfite exporter TauE/SafE family protein [Candidatus Persebacteraceae bacterium AB1(2)]
MVWELLFYAGIGSLAGFFAGLLGIGGGLIIVPLLIILLDGKLSDAYAVQMSVATSLAVIVVTAVPSFLTHAKGGRVFWRIAAWMLTGACVGAPLVAIVAQHIPGKIVQGFLILFMLHHSWHLFFNRRSPVSAASLQLSAPLLAAMGSFVGGMSALLGIGAGALSVPFLSRRGIALPIAIGTAAFMGFPLAFFAHAGYIIGGWGNELLPEGTWGYVFFPAFWGIAVFSMAFAVIGARITARLPEHILRRVFGALLLVLAGRMLWQLLSYLY